MRDQILNFWLNVIHYKWISPNTYDTFKWGDCYTKVLSFLNGKTDIPTVCIKIPSNIRLPTVTSRATFELISKMLENILIKSFSFTVQIHTYRGVYLRYIVYSLSPSRSLSRAHTRRDPIEHIGLSRYICSPVKPGTGYLDTRPGCCSCAVRGLKCSKS
jgi:hypothetical protein